jgi:uncharacterized membrane protein HdeD (DUF308 family)
MSNLDPNVAEPTAEPPRSTDVDAERVYWQFGKRNLDGMSWLAPLVNNRLGDLLNIELRHEQLFLIQGTRILRDIGYNEKGQRFSEAEMGKPIGNLDALTKNGYWLIGRPYDPEIMEEALTKQDDGYYYCCFSNQCQNWADRLRRSAERLEKQRGLASPQMLRDEAAAAHYSKPIPPTEPASIGMGVLSSILGLTAAFARTISGPLFTAILGVIFLVFAGGHVAYGLHARDWRNLLTILLGACGLAAAGIAILLNRHFATMTLGSLLTIVLASYGAWLIAIGVSSRPFWRGLGPMAAGILIETLAALVALRWPMSGMAAFGLWVGIALFAGGVSTIWLSWFTRREDASPAAT